jgi:hypothetical protein
LAEADGVGVTRRPVAVADPPSDGGGDLGAVSLAVWTSKLWDLLERAHDEWSALGRPPRKDFGLTV